MSRIASILIRLLIAGILCISALSPTPFQNNFNVISVAYADDDDDDDDRVRPRRNMRSAPDDDDADDDRVRPRRNMRSAPDDDDDDDRVRPRQNVRSALDAAPVERSRPPARRSAPPADRFEPRQILAINATPAVLNRVRALGFRVGQTVSLKELNLRVTRLHTPTNRSTRQALRILQRRVPNGNFVLNHIYRTAAAPCPETRCYGSTLIDWEASAQCSQGVRLGMVDTAANPRNPALQNRQIVIRSFAEEGGASSATHGTAVAAILIGAPGSGFPGLLADAELYAADTFIGSDPKDLRTNAFLLSQGLEWLLEQQASVVNASLTGPDNRLLRLIINRLSQRNIPVIAAAGNGGPGAPPAFPAAYPSVIAVTAVDKQLRPYRRANRGEYLTVAAPGVRIWTPGPEGGQYSDGTSFATPYVTAIVALLRHRQPHLTPVELIHQLKVNARDLGAPGKDPVFGWGLAQNLVRCDGPGSHRSAETGYGQTSAEPVSVPD